MRYLKIVLLALFILPAQLFCQIRPLRHAHAHNDYAHKRPLQDALDNGFMEVEADVFLIDGELYVAHTRPLRKDSAKTLRNLYLRPLQARILANKGRVYPNTPDFFYLMIDFKTAAEPTYQVLREQLQAFQSILSIVRDSSDEADKPVKIFISGRRPTLEHIQKDALKPAALDGLPGDLGRGIPTALMPVISTNFSNVLHWKGKGAVDPAALQGLKDLVQKAHAEGKKVRLWAAPDNAKMWGFLRDQGVDLINTDKLKALRAFLLERGE